MVGHVCHRGLGTREEQERRGGEQGSVRGTAEPLRCVPSIRSVMQKYLEDRGEVTFDKIFTQKIGELGTQGLGGTQGAPGPAPTSTGASVAGLGGLHWWPPQEREWP